MCIDLMERVNVAWIDISECCKALMGHSVAISCVLQQIPDFFHGYYLRDREYKSLFCKRLTSVWGRDLTIQQNQESVFFI